jgi:hypothetical protein
VLSLQLEKYSLNASSLYNVWTDESIAKGTERRSERICANIQAIQRLESQRPGITQFLNTNYGIANFMRLPSEALIDFYDHKDSINGKYVLLVQANSDHNGAFRSPADLAKMYKKLKKHGYHIVPMETGDIDDMLDKMTAISQKYGLTTDMLLLGHGEEHGVQLNETTNEYFNEDVLSGSRLDKFKKCLAKRLNVIFDSCSTGKRNGIAHRLSSIGADVFDQTTDTIDTVNTVGPDIPSGIKSYNFDVTDKGLVWKIKHYKYVPDDLSRNTLLSILKDPMILFRRPTQRYTNGEPAR